MSRVPDSQYLQGVRDITTRSEERSYMPRLNDPSEDPTQGRRVGHNPDEDPTQGREVGEDPYDDPTQGREISSDPYEDPTRGR